MRKKGAYSGDQTTPHPSFPQTSRREATWGSHFHPWSFHPRTVCASDKGRSTPSDIAGPQSSCFCQTGFLAAVTGPALADGQTHKGANPGSKPTLLVRSTRQSYLGNSPDLLGFLPLNKTLQTLKEKIRTESLITNFTDVKIGTSGVSGTFQIQT